MAREYIKSEVIRNQALTASTPVTVDLGVNGISFLFFHLTVLQTAANTAAQMADLAAVFANIAVLYKGQAIWSANGVDTMRMARRICGRGPRRVAAANATNAELGLSFVLPMG